MADAAWEGGGYVKAKPRAPHPFLPTDEERHAAIVHATRLTSNATHVLALKSHKVTFLRVAKRILVVYTPFASTNMQSSDWVNVSTCQAAGGVTS